jgi:hypothetical protein
LRDERKNNKGGEIAGEKPREPEDRVEVQASKSFEKMFEKFFFDVKNEY